MKLTGALAILMSMALGQTLRGQAPATPNKVESPTVKVLTGLTVPEFIRDSKRLASRIVRWIAVGEPFGEELVEDGIRRPFGHGR